jgi:hypothetical protein
MERGNNNDSNLDSRNFGHVSKRDMDALNSLASAKRIHFTHFTVPALPWHQYDEEGNRILPDPERNNCAEDSDTDKTPVERGGPPDTSSSTEEG